MRPYMKMTINDIEMASEKKSVIAKRIQKCLASEDFQEGLKSIAEKRIPNFKV